MNKKILLLLFFLLTFSLYGTSQVIVIEGKQVKKSQNVQYFGTPVYVPQKSIIKVVEGVKTSFSLRIDNQTKYQFYYTNGKYEPAISNGTTIIAPGMYHLYPDLPIGKDSAWIRIKLVATED